MLYELEKILSTGSISTLYQPIIDKFTGEIFAYEALSRGPSDSPLHSPGQLFEYARQNQLLSEIEALCRKTAIQGFVEQQLPGKLFINITPQSLEQTNHQKGQTLQLLDDFSLNSSQLVIELTEQYPSSDENLLLNALKYYQNMGFAIALDDLGAGYSSLRLWSQAKPEFVKIDRHFIQDIDLDSTKQEFVRSFVEIAKSMQCKVIAEGVETESEHEYLSKLSIDYLQGYYFCRPQQFPPKELKLKPESKAPSVLKEHSVSARNLCVHNISVTKDDTVEYVAQMFQDRPNINSIAVVDNKRILGLIQRTKLQGKLSQAFGRELYTKKSASEVAMEAMPLVVDALLSIEQVSRLVTSRARYNQEDDFVIGEDGLFIGIGHVIDLLKQVTELQLNQARHANPLTHLPGLIPINDCIDHLMMSNNRFVVTHFDIDNFKPFNDVYGFAKGDEIILALGQSLQKFASTARDTVGHIGGDDFIVLWNSEDWQQRVMDLTRNFYHIVSKLYYPEHVSAGGFHSTDRYGEERFHPIVSISVAAIEIEKSQRMTHFEVSSKLSPLKHAAKAFSGNSLVVNTADCYYCLDEAVVNLKLEGRG